MMSIQRWMNRRSYEPPRGSMPEPTDVTAHLARWSQALVGIAKTGLAFAGTPYDVERYEQLLKLAAEMTASQAYFD
jgi:Hydrolase of X-linked nucleoside diphosphate N terminal